MTDEEMAEEYIKNNNLEWELECHRTSPIGEVKQAFLAGLKAGSQLDKVWHDYDAGEDCYEDTHEGRWIKRENTIEWHDLRENPNDLPPLEGKTVSKDVLTNYGTIAYYHYGDNTWYYYNGYKLDQPKAWCEIPKYTEE